jgi:hypothetical protein
MARQSPRTVQDLLGHKTLEMTMKVCAKVFPENKLATIGSLPYGGGGQGDARGHSHGKLSLLAPN